MTSEQVHTDIATEVHGAWRKARASQGGGACVEVADLTGRGVAVRDSKHPAGPVLRFPAAEWSTFLAAVHTGDFDRTSAAN